MTVRLLASSLVLVLSTLAAAQESEQSEDLIWEEIIVGERGDIYSIDPLSIEKVQLDERELTKANARMNGFTGHPEFSEITGEMLFECNEPFFYAISLQGRVSIAEKFLRMPAPPMKLRRRIPNNSPMKQVADRVCAAS